jgi:predicted HicB family RNase H-like nuclease
MKESSRKAENPSIALGSPDVPESPKTTLRWDEGLKSDAERCAKERGISVAEFVRQSVAHYVAWTAAQKDESPQR